MSWILDFASSALFFRHIRSRFHSHHHHRIAIEFMSIDSKIMTCTSSMQTQIALSDAATDSVENTVVQEIRFNSLNPDVTRMLSMALSP